MVQATPAQQAELKKIKALQEKLQTELASLSQKMAELQAQSHTYEAVDGAKNQVQSLLLPLRSSVLSVNVPAECASWC